MPSRTTDAGDRPLFLSEQGSRPSQAVLPPTEAQLRGVVLLFPIALLSLGPHFALWGPPETPFPTDGTSILLFVGAFVLGTILHEVFHGVGHAWGEASWSDVRFGMHWRALTPFASCEVPVRARSYRLAVGLPGLVLGMIPLGVGLAIGHWLTTFFGFLMLVAAAGDILVLWILRGVPSGAWVQDHPREVGCIVVADASAPAPASVSEDDLADEQLEVTEGVSLRRIAYLLAIPLMCVVAGVLLAVTLV